MKNRKKYFFVIIAIFFALFIVSMTNQAKESENGLKLDIVTNQTEGENGKEIEIQFHIENTSQIPISNIILYSKSQEYVTRIAMLQPGEKQVFTKGESSKLLHKVVQGQAYLESSLYAEGIIKDNEKTISINNQIIKKIKIV